jgi:hypothetical protein
MSELKNTEITGSIRNSIVNLGRKLTGNTFKNFKVSSQFQFIEIATKDKTRWFISTVAGMKDRARGFYRQAMGACMTGNIIRHNKITDRFTGIYVKGVQHNDNVDGYGRCYQSDTDIELGTGGVLKYIGTDEEITVYKIKAVMQAESLVWADITNYEVYTKGV